MPSCAICGEHDGLNNKCNYCGKGHCKAHTLPENHRCVGLGAEGWETYREASEARNEGNNESSSQSGENTSWGRDWSTTPAKEKKRSHSGWWKKDKKETEKESQGDDSPPVKTTTQNSQPSSSPQQSSTESKPLRQSITSLPIYGLLKTAVAFISTAITFIVDLPLRIVRFVFSLRGFLFILFLTAGIGGYSAFVGTGIDAVDDTVDGVVDSGRTMLAGLSDESSAHVGGEFGTARLEGKQLIVEVEESNFDKIEVVTPGGTSDSAFVTVPREVTFTARNELPSGTYTFRAIEQRILSDDIVVNSYTVELSQ